jgi:hypothetical protein
MFLPMLPSRWSVFSVTLFIAFQLAKSDQELALERLALGRLFIDSAWHRPAKDKHSTT